MTFDALGLGIQIPLGFSKDPSVDRILGELPKDAKQKLGMGFKQAFGAVEKIGTEAFGRLRRVAFSAMGAAGIGGLGYEIKKVADLDRATKQLARTANLSEEQEAALGQTIKDTAIETGVARDEQIAALQLLQDRFASVNALANDNALEEQLKMAASLSKGFGMSIEDATILLGSLNKTGGVGTEDMVETLAFLEKAANMGASGLQDMGRVFPELLSESRAFGKGGVENVRDVAAMLETVTKKIGDPERAKTYTRQLIAGFQKGDVAAKLMKNLGVSTADANGEFRDLSDILDDTMNALGDMPEAKRAATLGDIFGSEEAVSAMSTIMQNKDAFHAILEVQADSEDFTKFLREQADSTATQMERLAQEVRILVDDAIEPLGAAITKHKDAISATVKWMATNPIKTALGVMFGPTIAKYAMDKLLASFAKDKIADAIAEKATGTMTVTAGVVNVNSGVPGATPPGGGTAPATAAAGAGAVGAAGAAAGETVMLGAAPGLAAAGGLALASIPMGKGVMDQEAYNRQVATAAGRNLSFMEFTKLQMATKPSVNLSGQQFEPATQEELVKIFGDKLAVKIADAVAKGAEAGTSKAKVQVNVSGGNSTTPPGEAVVQPG